MQRRWLHHIALWVFLLGILFIVFIQFISSRNINRLTGGNQKMQSELKLQNDLRRIESDILTIESDVRGVIITSDSVSTATVRKKIQSMDESLAALHNYLPVFDNQQEFDLLNRLVREKIAFSNQVLSAYYKMGTTGGQALVNSGRGQVLRDSIIQVISYLDSSRQKATAHINGSIEKSGSQARIWVTVLGVIACILLIIAFWYVLRTTDQQQKMIESLNESERKIKEAARLKEQFLANMSHEIRTPMNAIIGFTSILKRTDLKPEQRQYMQNIHTAGENLLVLINDILDLSKIEAGMMQLEETNFSLRSIVGSVRSMFADKVAEKNIFLRVEIEDSIPDILTGDAVRLTQILVNLVSNAIKFTEQGGVSIIIRQQYAKEEKVGLQIQVKDTGIGIAKEKQAAIFERFQQAEAETTRRFGGTGLGLSIVMQLIELHRGTIKLESALGKGSVFILELEYKMPNEDDLLSNALAAETKAIPLEEINVLIAEDNMMNQQLIKHLMKNWGIKYRLVNNGAEAVEALKQEDFSIILMDIQMPEMDGYTATEKIRKEINADIPIIAMTAHAMTGEKEKCLQLGMNDYISKPLKETVLYNIIAQYSYYKASI